MHCKAEELCEAEQAFFGLRLEAMVTRLASKNMQEMLDFDHLADEGLSGGPERLLPQKADLSLLDRENL